MTTPAGNNHITANVVLLVLMMMLGAFSTISVTLNLLSFFEVIDLMGTSHYASDAERAGGLTAFVWMGTWAAMMSLLSPIAAAGLWLRRSWGRKLAMAVWAGSLIGCCCTLPVCAYGLWSLSTTEVKDHF